MKNSIVLFCFVLFLCNCTNTIKTDDYFYQNSQNRYLVIGGPYIKCIYDQAYNAPAIRRQIEESCWSGRIPVSIEILDTNIINVELLYSTSNKYYDSAIVNSIKNVRIPKCEKLKSNDTIVAILRFNLDGSYLSVPYLKTKNKK